MTTVVRRRAESLAHVIGREEHCAARPTVAMSCLDDAPEVVEGRGVADGVVNENAVEEPAGADGSHVAEVMLAFGVQGLADLEHAWGDVHQRQALEDLLHVGCVISTAAAQFEHALDRNPGMPP